MSTEAADATREVRAGPATGADRGWTLARWVTADPIRGVAAALIVTQLAWRAQIASRGFLAVDDFALISHAHESRLRPDYVFGLFNNHLMPGGQVVTWLVTKGVGLAYWPFVLLMVAAQAAVDVALFRLLRRMLLPGLAMLLPLALFLFSPLTLEASSWWAVGVNLLPMQLAMVLAIGAHVSYLRTGRRRHLTSTALAVLLGLAFFEKSLLIVPLLFLVTACLYARGGPVRSVWEPLRRYWQMWAVLLALAIGYLAFYLSRAQASARRPQSADEVLGFLRQVTGSTVLPGLVGGPWRWLGAGDGAPVTAPSELARWLAWAVVLAISAGTVLVRPSAARAWLLLYVYLGLVVGLIGSTRLGSVFSAVAGLVPRYVGDVVVVAAICLGAALLGVAAPAPPDRVRPLPALRLPAGERRGGITDGVQVAAGALVAALGLYLLSAGWTAARFGDGWAHKQGRDYLRTATAEVAAAPPTTVFFDAPVPEGVVGPLSAPYNQQARFFAAARNAPHYVTSTARLSMLDDQGHIRRGWVEGIHNQPGPLPVYGYQVGTDSTWIPLQHPAFDWRWAVRIAYTSNADTTATFQLGDSVTVFPVQRGLNAYFFVINGGGAFVRVSVDDPAANFKTNEITVGNPVPLP